MNSSNELEITENNNLISMDEEQNTINYLQQHHDFFNHHQELLLSLKIPHLNGGAVSLIERQVSIFREQNINLRKSLDELVIIAKDNESSNLRMHKLNLALLGCEGLDAIKVVLDKILCDEFSVDSVALKLFIEPVADQPEYLFGKADSVLVKELQKLLNKRKPTCGFFKNLPLQSLFGEKFGVEFGEKFGEKADSIASLAVIPLFIEKNSCFGVLVLGSQNVSRFSANMGTHFLEKLGEILSHVLGRNIPQ
jgi:uncharacterized protein YigA (DUF484 family)